MLARIGRDGTISLQGPRGAGRIPREASAAWQPQQRIPAPEECLPKTPLEPPKPAPVAPG